MQTIFSHFINISYISDQISPFLPPFYAIIPTDNYICHVIQRHLHNSCRETRYILAKRVVLEERPTFKEELKKMSTLSFRELMWYIWQYYKYHVTAIVCIIALVVMIITAVVNAQKETLVSGIILNVSHYTPEDPDYFQNTYLQYLGKSEKDSGLDLRTDLSINTEDNSADLMSAYTLQVFSTLLSGNMEDFVICDADTIAYIQQISGGVLADLSQALTQETFDRMVEEDRLYESDSPVYHEDGSITLDGEPFPAAIDISDSHLCRGLGIPEDNTVYICFLSNSPTPEHFEELITYLFDYTAE